MADVHDARASHRFELPVGDDVAVLEYALADGVMTFTHTFVPESLRGRGLATRLVEAGLAGARAEGLRVVPVCPTVVAYMRAHGETHDLLTPDARTSLAV